MSSAWNSIRLRRPMVPWHTLVWFPNHIPRASFILWLAINRRLSTQDRLRSPTPGVGCLFCNGQLNSHAHLFFDCSPIFDIWTEVLHHGAILVPSLPWPDLISWMSSTWKGRTLDIIDQKLCLAAMVYTIWNERNKRYHENSVRRSDDIVLSIANLVRE